jgi:hypothetical protein
MSNLNKSSNNFFYKLSLYSIFFSFLTVGVGNHLLGIEFPFDISTLGIYFLFLIQIFSFTLLINRTISYIFIFIFIQTFILNFGFIDINSSLRHFIGLFIFTLSLFTFISNYRNRINDIVYSYYKFSFFLSLFAIVQLLLFLLVSFSFIPQNLFSGRLVTGNKDFVVEIFGVLPRLFGLSTEPSHFAVMLLPSVYLVLTNFYLKNYSINRFFNISRYIIILAFILSFSVVGYFGFFLIILFYFLNSQKLNFIKFVTLFVLFIVVIFFIYNSSLSQKVNSLINSSYDISGTNYTTNDQTAFALLSNLLVAKEGLFSSNFIGTGINSHQLTYNKFITNLFSQDNIPAELNKETAGSLFIRITSEFGLLGIFLFFIFLYINLLPNRNIYFGINQMAIIFLLTYSARTGHYISNIFLFFFAIYYYSFKLGKCDNLVLEYEN